MSLVVYLAILAIAITSFLFLGLRNFLVSRRAFFRLQAQNVPMPPVDPLLGHLLVLKECSQELPKKCTFHVFMQHVSRRFPGGIFYLDLWPFSKTLIVVYSPTAASQVENASLDKPEEIIKPLDVLTGGPTLLTAKRETWKKWRGLFNPGFSTGSMIGLAPIIAEEVAVFCSILTQRAKDGEMFQLEEHTLRLTFDIIANVILEAKLNYQRQDSELADALRTQVYWTTFGTTFNPFRRWLSPRPIVQWWNSKRMNGFLLAEIRKRMDEREQALHKMEKNGKNRSKSVVALALDDFFEDKRAVDEKEKDNFMKFVMPQLRLFLYAGHDTTSSTLLYCYYLLSKHPAVLKKVRDEHDKIFGSDPSVHRVQDAITNSPQLLNQIPYTLAVIKESLRLYPPSASMRAGSPNLTIVDDEGLTYPTEGCNIWVLNLALHRNPKVWVRSEEFIPERFLVSPDDPLYPMEGSWRAFEWGPRNCIGQTLALLELRVALVMTLRLFDIQPSYEEWDALHPTPGIKTVDGNRAYQAERGGGGARPADSLPCRVNLRK